jgi:rhomboid protease GluP
MSAADERSQPRLASSEETFAQYLTRFYTLRRGFALRSVPEAEALAVASDVVLTRSDGVTFEIICIVDGEQRPGKRFELPPSDVRDIAQRCLRYAGTVNGQKMPVTISIMEIGSGIDEAEERARLRSYKRSSVFSKGIVRAWLIDVSSRSVWGNGPFRGGLTRTFLERMLREPRKSDQELCPPQVAADILQDRGWPWVAFTLLALLVGIFSCEVVYRLGWGKGLVAPDIRTLLAFGGLEGQLVTSSGEWFRLLSAPLLHADLIHLVMNGIALLLVGYVLERMVGRAWFIAVFVIGAAAGSLMSMTINSPLLVSVGASGAIMALFAFAFVCTFHFPEAGRTAVQYPLLRVLVPSLIPLAASSGHKVDFAAHLGGALAGFVAGLALVKLWPSSSPRPPGRWLAASLALCGVAAFATAFVAVRNGFGEYQIVARLIPADQLPKTDAEGKSASQALVTHFPDDPRSHLYRALSLMDTHDWPNAEAELRTTLRELALMRDLFGPTLRDYANAQLATVLTLEGRVDDARLVANLAGLHDWQPPRPPEPIRKRSQSEVDQVLSRNGSANGAIFGEYFRRKPRTRPGTVALAFTVAPDGSVTECHTVSSSYNDPELEGQLADQLRKLRFSANDPRDSQSYTYSITFGRLPPST